MLRLIPLSLITTLALPLTHVAAQGPMNGGPTASEEVARVSDALYAATRQGDWAAVAAHFADEVTAAWGQTSYAGRQDVADHWFVPASVRVFDWNVTPERFDEIGDVVHESGTYFRWVETGLCDWNLVEPKNEREARDRRFCGPMHRTPAYYLEKGVYRAAWKRSLEGVWKLARIEMDATP